ncbi:MAG: metallophosphoesterase family protein [Patescibacteria group bacterium]|nr:metallophosphoesterase family protein [Patescibacteria group bacterium]
MRLAIISDIHGNFVALQAVLDHIRAQSADEIVCLGDIVGYGPDPRRCLTTVRRECSVIVLGNHEEAVLFPQYHERIFNELALRALRFTCIELNYAHDEFFKALPQFAWNEEHRLMFAHASFNDEEDFPYIDGPEAALYQLGRTKQDDTRVFFIGHTHEPFVCSEKEGGVGCDGETPLLEGDRFVINVGSVGQPRDEDVRACYGLLDTDDWTFAMHRVKYDVQGVVQQMADVGLPEELSSRLFIGA